jgi:hypothetical protein
MPYGMKGHMKAKLIYHEKFVYADGTCMVRYDNESGKGDHRHIKGKEEPYQFRDVETLVADFLNEIEKTRTG